MRSRGFTIIETVLIVILISILAAILIPRFSVGSRTAKIQSCEMNRSIINTMVETFYFVEGTWPLDSLTDIKANDNYFPDGIPTCPVDETSYELKPSPKHRVTGHVEGAGTHVLL
ncbi:MAG TPA: type II secretion system protein [bacterium]|nr:type II secretion system protein [bacterium]